MEVNQEKVRKRVIELAKSCNENVLSIKFTNFYENLVLVNCDYAVSYMFLYNLDKEFKPSLLQVFGLKTGVEIAMQINSSKYFK